MLLLITFILGIGAIQARIFNNPVLGGRDYYDPSAIKVNGTYYMTTRNLDYIQTEKIENHVSTDLINWKSAGYVFNETNFPQWAKKNNSFEFSKLFEIRGNYIVYFNVYNETGRAVLGVAVAPHPLGPYTAIDQPLFKDYYCPTIANDNGSLYLILWQDGNFIARQMTSDGLSFASDETFELLRPNLAWERSYIANPYYIRRGEFHYIMYTGDTSCKTRRVGIARSRYFLGPYEKLPDPILDSNNDFKTTDYNGWIKDLDDQSDVIVFESSTSEDCLGTEQINLASVGWNADNWPYIYDY